MPQAAIAAPAPAPDLQALRARIDRIDNELLDLMEQRFACAAGEAGEADAGLSLRDGSLHRRAASGEAVKTLAICGSLRLCVSRKPGDAR